MEQYENIQLAEQSSIAQLYTLIQKILELFPLLYYYVLLNKELYKENLSITTSQNSEKWHMQMLNCNFNIQQSVSCKSVYKWKIS